MQCLVLALFRVTITRKQIMPKVTFVEPTPGEARNAPHIQGFRTQLTFFTLFLPLIGKSGLSFPERGTTCYQISRRSNQKLSAADISEPVKPQMQHPRPETLSSPKSPRSSWNGILPTNTGALEEHSGLLRGVYIICSSLPLKVCNKIKQIHTKIK